MICRPYCIFWCVLMLHLADRSKYRWSYEYGRVDQRHVGEAGSGKRNGGDLDACIPNFSSFHHRHRIRLSYRWIHYCFQRQIRWFHSWF